MKKIFVRITMAVTMAAAMASCARVEEPLSSDGETRQVTLSVNIPQSDLDSKAAGDGTQVNRCILQIYCGEDKYGDPVVESVAGGTADFNLQLVTGQDYKFVLWADAGGSDNSDNHYDTSGFPEVAFKGDYTGNDDSWDAFCANVDITGFNGTLEPVTLTRPFGQLNIYTEDIDEIKAGTLKPDKVKVKFNSIPASYDILYDIIFGVSSGETGIEYTADVVETSDEDSDGKYLLSTDYIFAPSTEQALLDFTMTFLNGDTEITSYDFSDIPLQRNYRTNVRGNLLTKSGALSVTVDADFDSHIEKEVKAVAALSDVKAALEAGADIVDVTGGASGELVLPAVDRDITVNLKGNVTGDVTVNSVTDNYTGHFTISNETEGDNSHDLVINLPNGSASVDGNWGNITANTSSDTIILEEGADVEKLTVQNGNVEIYGHVDKIEFGNDNTIIKIFTVYDAESFKYASSLIPENRCAKIVLGDDIDLNGSEDNKWEPIDAEGTRFSELDGAGYTVSNLYVDNYTGHDNVDPYYYGGLFYVLQGDVVNLTIDGANVWCHRGGALVGRMDFGTVKNCYIKNANIHSYQKAGGLIGFVSNHSKNVTITGCVVENCGISTVSPEEGLYQAGGLIGYLQSYDRNVIVENCSVSNISFDKVYESSSTGADKIYDQEQFYSHPFIGTIANFSKNPSAYSEFTIKLQGNNVDSQMTDIPVCDRTNAYVGWWAGYFNTSGYMYTPKLEIDGIAMDRWIEVKRLSEQIEAGGDVRVLRSYDFTMCNELPEKINIESPTSITIGNNAVLTVGKQQLINKSNLKIIGMPASGDKAAGAMTASSYIIMNESGAELTIDGGTFTATEIEDANGVAIYNQGKCTIENGTFYGPGFTLMNVGGASEMTLNDGEIFNGGNPTGYALIAVGGANLTVNGGYIEAIQSLSRANVTINGGTVHNDCRYYAIYNQNGNTRINGGYFSGYDKMDDVYITGGEVIINGGCFEDNKAVLPDGYAYKNNVQTINDIAYNYEVIKE